MIDVRGGSQALYEVRNEHVDDWIVDPRRRTIECDRLLESHYELVLTAESPARLLHPGWPGMSIDVGAIWR